MRVLYLANAKSIHVQRWANYFSDRGWRIYLLSYTPTKNENLRKDITQVKLFHIPKLENFIEPLNRVIRVKQIKRVLDRFEPDLIHAHDLAKYGEYAQLSNFRPYILTNWGLSDLRMVQNFLYFFNRPLKGNREKLRKNVFMDVSAVTCLVEEAKGVIVNTFQADAGKIHAFPWGVDTNLFYKGYEREVNLLREELGIPN